MGDGFPHLAATNLWKYGLPAAAVAAHSDLTVLITGQHNVQMRLLAEWIHVSGPRRRFPFVVLNCTACANALLDRQLSHHLVSGGVPHGGTVLLHQVDELPQHLQRRLFTLLETAKADPFGRATPPSGVRVIATARRTLFEAVRGQQFHEALYYRLNAIHIPSDGLPATARASPRNPFAHRVQYTGPDIR
jgi:DNA-binding NtrC family response regulator